MRCSPKHQTLEQLQQWHRFLSMCVRYVEFDLLLFIPFCLFSIFNRFLLFNTTTTMDVLCTHLPTPMHAHIFSLPLSVSHSILKIRYFRLFFIAILFDIKKWICAVSFNMWLNVYNGYNVMMRCYISSILNTITLNQSKKFPFIARKWIKSVQTFALQLCAQLKTGCEIEKRSQPKWAQCIGHDGRSIR